MSQASRRLPPARPRCRAQTPPRRKPVPLRGRLHDELAASCGCSTEVGERGLGQPASRSEHRFERVTARRRSAGFARRRDGGVDRRPRVPVSVRQAGSPARSSASEAGPGSNARSLLAHRRPRAEVGAVQIGVEDLLLRVPRLELERHAAVPPTIAERNLCSPWLTSALCTKPQRLSRPARKTL